MIMAAHWDHPNSHPILSSLNGDHGQTNSLQPPHPEPSGKSNPPVPPLPEIHGFVTPSSPPFRENTINSFPYYEGYTIKPDDFTSSEDRWSFPPKKSIPATQEDLHTEVIRQRQSGRTACRELEDCHGPKRQYIDRLVRERNASTLLGHFEVAQLRLERIPKDSGKASNRNTGWNYHTRDYKQKDPTKSRQRTVYMHIILQFIKNSDKNLAEILPNNLAPCSSKGSNCHRSTVTYTSEEDVFVPPRIYDSRSPKLPGTSRRPLLARGYPYTTGTEQASPSPSTRYNSQGTQTSSQVHTGPHCDCYVSENSNDPTFGNTSSKDNWTTTASSMKDDMPSNSHATDNEIGSTGDSSVGHEVANGSIEEESRGVDEYEKPPWFQNLRPGLLPLYL